MGRDLVWTEDALRRLRKMPEQKPGRSKQDYSTDPAFIAAVVKRFGKLDFDLAAHDDGSNAQASRWFGPSTDSLKQDWSKLRGTLWLNPPFGRIEPWAKKCAETKLLFARILFLVPAAVGSNWYAKCVHEKALVFFLNGRLCFDGKNGYPKDCLLSLYDGPCRTPKSPEVWRWK
jgi:phage N-6-adenine-methyltransferase